METLGVITLTEYVNSKGITKKIYPFVPRKILNFIIDKFISIEYQYIDISKIDMNICIAKLPFNKKQLDMLDEKTLYNMCEKISHQFKLENIQYVILPTCLSRNKNILKFLYTKGQFNKSDDQNLFISLIPDILIKVCKIAGLELKQLSVGIVESQLTNISTYLIENLSSSLKYATLVTKDIETATTTMEKIFERTGLSIWISNDIRSALTDSNIIFVLDDFNEFMRKALIDKKSILFNLKGKVNHSERKLRNIVIDSIDISIPAISKEIKIFEQIGITNKRELIEYVLSVKVEKYKEQPDMQQYESMRRIFYELGCKINLLRGFNSPINIDQIKKNRKKLEN